MELNTVEKLKLLIKRKEHSLKSVSQKLNCTHQNLSAKLNRGNLTENDIRQISEAIGYDVKISFIDKETKEIL